MRLLDLPEPYRSRVTRATGPESWAPSCDGADRRACAWLAWNVREDTWYGADELEQIQGAIDEAPADAEGPDLLLHIVETRKLEKIRRLRADEQGHLPIEAINHFVGRLSRRYELTADSVWEHGTATGEPRSTFRAGDRFQVIPSILPGGTFTWLTFDTSRAPVPREPDEIARQLGLTYGPTAGTVVRVTIPMKPILDAGAALAIPTLFDGLYVSPTPDWRARPESEQRPDEPWGNARDMRAGGAALPEILADISSAGVMEAECVGPCREDWRGRPYLDEGDPR